MVLKKKSRIKLFIEEYEFSMKKRRGYTVVSKGIEKMNMVEYGKI